MACASTNEMTYINSYNYLLKNKMSEIRQFVEEESGSSMEAPIDIIVSREIVHLESIFFENKSNELLQWETFKDVTNVKSFLWGLDSESSFNSFTSETELVQTNAKSSNLILFFSKMEKGLLLAELVWVPELVTDNANYKEVAMFGRSLRFLFEFSGSDEVKNLISMEIHHN